MNKTIEKEFFKAFESGGVVNNCFDWMGQKYDLGFKPYRGKPHETPEPLPEEWQNFYDVTLPEQIFKETEAFNDGVIKYIDSPLMEEIANNLDECQNRQQQDRYVFSLLKPFKEFSDIYHPLGVIKQLKGGVNGVCGISDCQKDLEFWKSMPTDEYSQGQITACRKMIEDYQYRIERAEYVANRYIEITCRGELKKNCVEQCLSAFVGVANRYANWLDALLLEHGFNLLWYQQQSGIFLKESRLITDVSFHLGSIELARKYIDEALPKLEQEPPQDMPKDEYDAQPNKGGAGTSSDTDKQEYSQKLLTLFKNHTDLLRQLHGLTDDDKARKIAEWGKKKDKDGNLLICAPTDNLYKRYAEELKKNGFLNSRSLINIL